MNNQRLTIRTSSDSLAFATTDGREVVYERYPLKNGMSVAANMRRHDVHSPFLLGHDEPGDIVHHAVQESWKDYQLRMEI